MYNDDGRLYSACRCSSCDRSYPMVWISCGHRASESTVGRKNGSCLAASQKSDDRSISLLQASRARSKNTRRLQWLLPVRYEGTNCIVDVRPNWHDALQVTSLMSPPPPGSYLPSYPQPVSRTMAIPTNRRSSSCKNELASPCCPERRYLRGDSDHSDPRLF